MRGLLGVPFRTATYLRAVHILLGGVFLLPYVLLVLAFSTLSVGTAATDVPMLVALITLTAAIGVGVALIPAARSMEIVMARTLLGVDLPDPEPVATRAWSVRLRSAAWYVVCLLLGGLGSAVMVVALSLAVPLLLPPYRDDAPAAVLQLAAFGPDSPLASPAAGPPLAVLGLLVTAYLVAGLGAVQARIAPTALGPGPEEALLAAADDPPKVLVLTTFGHDTVVRDALRVGAAGFLVRRAHASEIVQAVRTVARGGSLLFPAAIRALAPVPGSATAAQRAATAGLTERERDVLVELACGRSNVEIARVLGLGVETVKSHLRAVLRKLDARDRTQAVVAAYRRGLVPSAPEDNR